MMDWTRHNEVSADNPEHLIWDQIILSLLYDEVAVQDETLVCSKKLAKWFLDKEQFEILKEVFECGGLKVLRRPLEAYPEELKDLAEKNPIIGRRSHLTKHSVDNDGNLLRFDDKQQLAFHDTLDKFLIEKPDAYRFAGSKQLVSKNIFQDFGDLLEQVLLEDKWKQWLDPRFEHVDESVKNDFVGYIRDPEKAIKRIAKFHSKEEAQRLLPPGSGPLRLTTAIAVRVAATYPKDAANELQSLIETVFANPYCKREGADGRYGRHVDDLPIEVDLSSQMDDSQEETAGRIEVVELDAIDVKLPLPEPGFAKVVNEVRRESGKNLRKAIITLDSAVIDREEQAIDKAIHATMDAWKLVADDFATKYSRLNIETIDARVSAFTMNTRKGISYGLLTGYGAETIKWAYNALNSPEPMTSPFPVWTVLGTSVGVISGALHSGLVELAGDFVFNELQRRRNQIEMRSKLENAVAWKRRLHPAIDATPKTSKHVEITNS